MSESELDFNLTFRDFQFLQGYMTRRIFAKHRRQQIAALLGVVVCAVLLAMAIVINAVPYRASLLFAGILPYPASLYLVLIVCLLAAIFALLPAVKLRTRMLRMQVSDDGPLLGPTRLRVETDGIVIDRGAMSAKYLWRAFQGVEVAKNAIILPIDNGIGVMIPARAFASDSARYEFAAAIAKRLEAEKPVPPRQAA